MAAADDSAFILTHGLADYRDPAGRDIVERCGPFARWVDASRGAGLFQFLRHHTEVPDTDAEVVGWGGHRYRGLNLASQDYLGLARHQVVMTAAAEACLKHGTHSAGSEPMGGGFGDAKKLEGELAEFVGHEHVVLFPTGWGAGYGAIKALVRADDHIVMDALAHDCLQHGARASTANITYFAHNDMDSLEKRLQRIRSKSPDAAILVVTESLFSMDSDHPDFRRFIDICRAASATTFVDVAHDLGVLGPEGRGVLAAQHCLEDIDIVMGSFSKTFASIGGFVATHSRPASYMLRGFSGTYTFSNFLMPAQVAAIHAALRIVRSAEGDALRASTAERALTLRTALQGHGLQVLGQASPIILPAIGAEPIARLAYRRSLETGVILNNIEYPACRRGDARFRLQVSPRFELDALRRAADAVADAVRWARAHHAIAMN
jgi:glycine C-acetyltransferase